MIQVTTVSVQTLSQLEVENARLKQSVQQTKEALDHSRTIEVNNTCSVGWVDFRLFCVF